MLKVGKTIKIFNKQANNSYDLEETHQRWSDYRGRLTEKVSEHLLQDRNLLVVGAGNLNDLNMNVLLRCTGKISLLDIDINAVKEGLVRQGLKPEDFELLEIDLTHLEDSSFFEEFKSKSTPGEYDVLFKKWLTKELVYRLDKFDNIVILPIYTQILFQQLLKNAKMRDEETMMLFMMFSRDMISRINSKLVKSGKDNQNF